MRHPQLLCMTWTTVIMKNFFLRSNLNLPPFILKLLPPVLSLHNPINPSPAFMWAPTRDGKGWHASGSTQHPSVLPGQSRVSLEGAGFLFFFVQPTCTGLTPGELHFGANSPDLSGFTSGTPLLTSVTLRAANAHSPDPHPTSSTSSAILARSLCSLQAFVLPSPPGADYPARGRALHSSEGAESHVDQVSLKH